MTQPVTLVITSGASDPSLSALPRCLPPALSAPRSSWTPRPWVSQAYSHGQLPAQMTVGTSGKHLCNCSLLERHFRCLWAVLCGDGSPKGLGLHRNGCAWLAKAVTAGDQEETPPPTPQPCAPSVSMVLLSDDPKGCEHGVLTSQSSPSQSPWCQVSQLDGSPEAPCHHFLFFQETTCPLAGFVQPHCRWWIWRMIKIVAGWLLNRDYINTMLTFQDWQAFCREEGHLFPSPMHITEPSYLLSTYWGLETMKMCFTSESLWRVSLSRNLISGWLSCSKEYNMRNLSILNDLKCKLNKKT